MNIWMNGKSLMKHHCQKKKRDFYNNLNMGSIMDAEYMHAKRTCNDFEIKKVW